MMAWGKVMNPLHFVIWSIGVGIGIPILWLIVYWTLLRGNPSVMSSLMSGGHLDQALLAVWPSSIFLAADPEDRSVVIPIVSVAVNAILYAGLGWLVWFGFYRNRVVLGLTVVAIVVGWYCLFNWYVGR